MHGEALVNIGLLARDLIRLEKGKYADAVAAGKAYHAHVSLESFRIAR